MRKLSCDRLEELEYPYELFQEESEDTEIRINSFLIIMKCSDVSEKFDQFATQKLPAILTSDPNDQVESKFIQIISRFNFSTISFQLLSF